MKKAIEIVKKKNDEPLDPELTPKLGHPESLEEIAERLGKMHDERKAIITSGNDLLDRAFNIALNKKFKKNN